MSQVAVLKILFRRVSASDPNNPLPFAAPGADVYREEQQAESVWMARREIKGGVAHGATDELGFRAVEKRHYVTDLQATVRHQLGLDSRRLDIPGRKRLELGYGQPIHEVLA